jgi:transcriptional regulator with XRE-family HTH domain
MQSLGAILREAREAMGASTSEAAAQTKIKVQHIEALEREEFDKIAAPIYVKGFLKMYAEYLGLDPGAMIELYKQGNAPLSPNEIVGDVREEIDSRPGAGEAFKNAVAALKSRLAERAPKREDAREPRPAAQTAGRLRELLARIRISPKLIRPALTLLGALLVLLLLISSIANCARRTKLESSERSEEDLSIIEGIPEPYIEPEFMPRN